MDYIRSKLPTQTVLSIDSINLFQKKYVAPSIVDVKFKKSVTSGRVALTLALQNAGISNNDEVLIPAYHCSSMVEPAIYLGAKPVFFRVNKDTTIDYDDIVSKITTTTKAIIIAHYFGFPQPIQPIRELCDKNKILLIEDCAHSFFGSIDGLPIGSYGDYAIVSAMKFFPVYDGGYLVSDHINLDKVLLQHSSIIFELKSFLNVLEKSFSYNRLKLLKLLLGWIFKAKDTLWGKIKRMSSAINTDAHTPPSSDGGFSLDARWLNKEMSFASKAIIRFTDVKKLIGNRKNNYLYLNNAIAKIEGCTPLYPTISDATVPYVVPVLVDNPIIIFSKLKQCGVPIIRFGEFLWPGVDSNICQNSTYLSAHVFQFPCHQSLTQSELDWMITKIADASYNANK